MGSTGQNGFADFGPKPRETFLLARGDFHAKGELLEVGFLSALTRGKTAAEYWTAARAQSQAACGCSEAAGGWESLALQIYHPEFFGGTWTSYPDPVDFRHYGSVDIYADTNAFVVTRRVGAFLNPSTEWQHPERYIMRAENGQPMVSMREYSRWEDVLGSHGRSTDQLEAWEAVYGPVGEDGYPKPLWDKRTGKIAWERVAYEGEPRNKRHVKSTYASSTPATDGRIVVAWFGSQGVHAYDVNGTFPKCTNLGSDTSVSWHALILPYIEQSTLGQIINPKLPAYSVAGNVNRVAGKYLLRNNRTVGMFLPTTQVARANIPLRSFGTARDIAEAVCFLASDRARYITAQAINVDGGYAA